MFRKCLPPFQLYKSSGPYYAAKEGRVRINLLHKKKSLNRNITYARYLLSVHSGLEPGKGFEVDHIDGDRTHDKVCNLQVLSKTNNRSKMNTDLAVTSKWGTYSLTCALCGKLFYREKCRTHLENQKHYCSKRCCALGWGKEGLSSEMTKDVMVSFVYKNEMEPWERYSTPLTEDDSLLFHSPKKPELVVCKQCKKEFLTKKSKVILCSKECIKESRQKVSTDAKVVSISKVLDKKSTWEEQGRILGISGSALRKWAKTYGYLK